MNDVLRRKLRPLQPETRLSTDPLLAHWRLALIRALHDMAHFSCEPGEEEARLRDLAELPEILPDHGLVILLETLAGQAGMVVLTPDFVAALIEMQTTGRILPAPALSRRPTRTDAAMIEPLIDEALGRFDLALREREGRAAAGFRCAFWLEDPRALGLMLEEHSWRVSRLDLSFGGGARQGEVLLALPASLAAFHPGEGAARAPGADAAGAQLALGTAECRLEAVLARLALPLSTVMSLQPGQLLVLPVEGVGDISVEIAGGKQVALAKLGQSRGARALRVTGFPGEGPAAAPGMKDIGPETGLRELSSPPQSQSQSLSQPLSQSLPTDFGGEGLPMAEMTFAPPEAAAPPGDSAGWGGAMAEMPDFSSPRGDEAELPGFEGFPANFEGSGS